MKCNVLKRALVLTALGASMATAAFAAPNGPVMIPQPGTVVVINHNPDVTFAGNINFDVESQENNNLKIGSTVVPNVLYGAVFNKSGAPDTIVPAQTYVFTGAKEVPTALTSPSDEGKPGATWSVETIKKTKSGDIQVASVVYRKNHWACNWKLLKILSQWALSTTVKLYKAKTARVHCT